MPPAAWWFLAGLLAGVGVTLVWLLVYLRGAFRWFR